MNPADGTDFTVQIENKVSHGREMRRRRRNQTSYQDHPTSWLLAPVANISEHLGKFLVISRDSGQYADANKSEYLMITDSSTNSGLSRRSFIKRSVVAAVAASSMTIFSGLVNAGNESPSPASKCKMEKLSGASGQCRNQQSRIWDVNLKKYVLVGPILFLCEVSCNPKPNTPDSNGNPRLGSFQVECDQQGNPLDNGKFTNTAGCY